MKKLFILTAIVALFVGCNFNENKEGRIRKLESEISRASSKIQELDERVRAIESPGENEN